MVFIIDRRGGGGSLLIEGRCGLELKRCVLMSEFFGGKFFVYLGVLYL